MRYAFLIMSLLAVLVVGCASEYNPMAPGAESDVLSGVTQLTFGSERAGEAYLSRDMQWVIFQAVPPGESQYQMYVAKVKRDGGSIAGTLTPIRISPPMSRNTCGYFSPDGNSIIFASTAGKEVPDEPSPGYQRRGGTYRWSFPSGMEIYRADGWQSAIAAAEPGGIVDLAKHRLTENDSYDAECAFSPDGKWIVFASKRTGDMELWAMRADGSDPVQLTHTPGYDGGPFFSPEGRRIVYRSDRKGDDNLQIFTSDLVFDSTGNITGLSNEKQLTKGADVNWGPFWHPDGRHIVYATSIHGHTNYEIYMMRDDGTRKTRVTFTDGPDVLPVVSPDGNYLLWATKRASASTQVHIARFRLPRGS